MCIGESFGADRWGVFDMPALEGLANEPGSGQPELGLKRPVALFDVFVWFEPGSSLLLV
jgi:hypothetical protein